MRRIIAVGEKAIRLDFTTDPTHLISQGYGFRRCSKTTNPDSIEDPQHTPTLESINLIGRHLVPSIEIAFNSR